MSFASITATPASRPVFDFETHPYTLDDLALDAVGVLDGYDIAAAHVVGASTGGMIVQTLMLKHRPRVRSAIGGAHRVARLELNRRAATPTGRVDRETGSGML